MARILVVEDDDAARYTMVKLLAAAGYEVADAHDYRDALCILEDGSPVDLLVTDVVLPEVHGFALARMARMKHRDLKCVHITSYDLPTSEAAGPVLRKPVGDDQLLGEVAKTLSSPLPA